MIQGQYDTDNNTIPRRILDVYKTLVFLQTTTPSESSGNSSFSVFAAYSYKVYAVRAGVLMQTSDDLDEGNEDQRTFSFSTMLARHHECEACS